MRAKLDIEELSCDVVGCARKSVMVEIGKRPDGWLGLALQRGDDKVLELCPDHVKAFWDFICPPGPIKYP